ncbi:hypothetical protein B7P43_G13500 [Cryptotermes secundus]|uniref:Gustatory receptor n=1 Tax=Cryptotermes secundus TaxID=105785 RepID=A0A2J7PYM2_9NEOP|nr:hypothetical protein B7P43_G13500 [Cryptotermes secundus]
MFYEFYLPEKIRLLSIISDIFVYSTGIVTLITSIFFNRRKLPCMLLKLTKVDEMIGPHKIKNIYKDTRLFIVRGIPVFLLLTTLIYLLGYFIRRDGTFANFAQIYVGSSVITINIFITLLYTDLIRILNYRYKYIIDDLEEHFKVKDMAVITDFKVPNPNYLFYCKDFPLYPTVRSNSLSVSSDSCKIDILRYVYVQLYDSVILLNSYFGIPILFEILTVIVSNVTALYSGLYFLRASHGDIKAGVIAFYMVFYGVQFLTAFAWFVTCCHNTSAEANRGVTSIQRIMGCSKVNHETSVELEKLSSQLDKMKVQFTACGFFSLNLPLLCTAIGLILTYILIAVQIN